MNQKFDLTLLTEKELVSLGCRVPNANGKSGTFGCDENRKTPSNSDKAAWIEAKARAAWGGASEGHLKTLAVAILNGRKGVSSSAVAGEEPIANSCDAVEQVGTFSDGRGGSGGGEHEETSSIPGDSQVTHGGSKASEGEPGSGSDGTASEGQAQGQGGGDDSDGDGESDSECESCEGTGASSETHECDTCNGAGDDEVGDPCETCQGSGESNKCEACNGTGESDSDGESDSSGESQQAPKLGFEFQPPTSANAMEELIRKLIHEEVEPLVAATATTFEATGEFIVAQDDLIKRGVQKALRKVSKHLAAQSKVAVQSAPTMVQPAHVKIEFPNVPIVDASEEHPVFMKVMALCCLPHNIRPNILLVGPPGSGKTTLAEHMAIKMNLRDTEGNLLFAALPLGADSSRGDLFGKAQPMRHGGFEYIPSDFCIMYESPGLFLLDELDASSPEVVVAFNASLSNGYTFIENRKLAGLPTRINRHQGNIILAGANTFGTGATAKFTGRAPLDGATLDRFVIIYMATSRALNAKVMGVPYIPEPQWVPQRRTDTDLRRDLATMATWLDRLQANVEQLGWERIIEHRARQKSVALLTAGFTIEETKDTILAGWDVDERAKVGA